MPDPARPPGGGPARHSWTGFVLGAALVALALVTGLTFTFSAAVMPNLAGVDDRTFVEISQRFNANPIFPAAFTLALLLLLLALTLQVVVARGPAVRWTVAALVLYALVLAITGGVHLPLNDAIDQVGDPARAGELARVRSDVEAPWVAGNLVRTLLCTAALATVARALLLHGRRPRPHGA